MVKRVSAWLKIKPPTIVIPSGRRNSEPTPVPSASGSAPSNAAMVVIMMGRKAQRACFIDRIHRRFSFPPLRIQREVNHHDGVLLHQSYQQNDAYHSYDVQLHVEGQQGQQRAHSG